jgi:hypothetical protein
MLDDKTTLSRPVEPLQVTVLDTGDGSKLATGDIATTPGLHLPNVVIKVVTPIGMILVRAAKGFMVSFMSLITAGPATGIISFTDANNLIEKCAVLSIVAGVVAGGWAFLEVLTKLDQKLPTWTA